MDFVDATDAAGNRTYSLLGIPPIPPNFPLFLTVMGTEDVAVPILQSLNLSRTNVNTSYQEQSILVTARVTDDLSGLGVFDMFGNGVFMVFSSPSGNQSVSSAIVWVSEASSNGLDIVFTNSLVIPRYSETGIWVLDYATLYDSAFNQRRLTLAEMQNLGLPFSFIVEEFPRLKLNLSGNLLLLSWPAAAEGFTLQAAESPSANWTSVPNSPVYLGGEKIVVLPMPGEKRFFRLMK